MTATEAKLEALTVSDPPLAEVTSEVWTNATPNSKVQSSFTHPTLEKLGVHYFITGYWWFDGQFELKMSCVTSYCVTF